MLLPAGRGRAEKKQNRTSSDLSGEQLQSSSLPWGGNAPEEAVSASFYPPFSALALLCSLWDMCSFPILLCSLVTLNQTPSRSDTAEFALHGSFFFFLSLRTTLKSRKLPHLLFIPRNFLLLLIFDICVHFKYFHAPLLNMCIIQDARCKIPFPLLILFAWIINWFHLGFTFFCHPFSTPTMCRTSAKKEDGEFLIRFSSFTSFSEKGKKAFFKHMYNSNICKSMEKRGLWSPNIFEYRAWMCQCSSSSYLPD